MENEESQCAQVPEHPEGQKQEEMKRIKKDLSLVSYEIEKNLSRVQG